MDVLLVLLAPVLLALAALRWGVDSRDRERTIEEWQAGHGLAWSGPPGARQSAAGPPRARWTRRRRGAPIMATRATWGILSGAGG